MSSPRNYAAFLHPTSNGRLCGAQGRVQMIRHTCITYIAKVQNWIQGEKQFIQSDIDVHL
jgi:hypothetical protein